MTILVQQEAAFCSHPRGGSSGDCSRSELEFSSGNEWRGVERRDVHVAVRLDGRLQPLHLVVRHSHVLRVENIRREARDVLRLAAGDGGVHRATRGRELRVEFLLRDDLSS